ncbi:hypothetical protein D9758_013908 [Tetrapyrgos nigripes]|uniref:Uncharacterized protein n=1 Tax=Tetrapyrgos nigripes TaxID=182062 RepID=A0A8H5CQ29_9AGAR|nr:hypothetical protein D9758_013908 [Tetrapyrgos nigripes]
MIFFKVSFLCIFLSTDASIAFGYSLFHPFLTSLYSRPSSSYIQRTQESQSGLVAFRPVFLAGTELDAGPRGYLETTRELEFAPNYGHNILGEETTDSRLLSIAMEPHRTQQTREEISLPTSGILHSNTYSSFWLRWRPAEMEYNAHDDDDDDDGNEHSMIGGDDGSQSPSPRHLFHNEKRNKDDDNSNSDSPHPPSSSPTPMSSSSSDTPVIVAAVLGTLLAVLITGLLVYFLRRIWLRKTKINDPEYAFANGAPNQIWSHSKSSSIFPLTERSRQKSKIDDTPTSSATNTLTSQTHSITQPPTLAPTMEEDEASPELDTGLPPSQGASHDPWPESRNFYATPKNAGPPVHRAGRKRKAAGASKVSAASRSTKSTTSSGFSRGSRKRRIRSPGSMITVSDDTTTVTEVSSIRFSPNTERQMEIDEKIQELQSKLSLVHRTIRSGNGGVSREAKTGSVTLANMTHDYRVWKWKRQIEKLKALKESDWAYGKTDVKPAGLYKYDGTSTSNL